MSTGPSKQPRSRHPARENRRPHGQGIGGFQQVRGSRRKTGRVQFDERGNAIWEWSIATGAFGREVSTQRLQKLEHPGSVACRRCTDAVRTQSSRIRSGTVKGYNPYDSGKLEQEPNSRAKRICKKLSDWLALKKQATNNKRRRVAPGCASLHCVASRVCFAVCLTRVRSAAWLHFPNDRTCAARAPAPRFALHPGSRNGSPGAGR